MTSWDSSVGFHINYSKLSCISHSPSARQHTHTHTRAVLHVWTQRRHIQSQCPCLKCSTLRDLYPFSIPHPEFITITYKHTYSRIHHTHLHYLTGYIFFSFMEAPIWLLMTFISLPLSFSAFLPALFVFHVSDTVLTDTPTLCFLRCYFPLCHTHSNTWLHFSLLRVLSSSLPSCPPFYLSLFSHYSLSLIH